MLYSTLTSVLLKFSKKGSLDEISTFNFTQVDPVYFRYFRFVYCDLRHRSYHSWRSGSHGSRTEGVGGSGREPEQTDVPRPAYSGAICIVVGECVPGRHW